MRWHAVSLKLESEDRPQLEIRLHGNAGGLDQRGGCDKKPVVAKRRIRTGVNEGVSAFRPIGKFDLVEEFRAKQEIWGELVTGTKGLFESARAFGEISELFSLPFGFKSRVVGEHDWPKVLLENEFAFKFQFLVSQFDFSIYSRADEVRQRDW